MKVIVFLGSGVSLRSGLPTVANLRRRLLRSPYHREGDYFRAGRPRDGSEGGASEIARIRLLIQLIERLDRRDRRRMGLARMGRRFVRSGAIYRSATTYEDVFAICQLIDDWMHGLSDTAAATSLLDLLERNAGPIVDAKGKMARTVAVGQLAIATKAFIQAVVANALRNRRIAGLDLLLELVEARDISQLSIVTLNHDTLVEQLMATAGVRVVDGFGEADGSVRWFDDACYDAPDGRVRLIKLHGSIDWFQLRRGDRFELGSVASGAVSGAVDSSGERVNPASLAPWFLTGGEKEAWYQHDAYADLHYRFHEVLRHADRMIMSGYGWGDTGISNQIYRWLDQRASNRLVLLHATPRVIEERSMLMQGGYGVRVQSGQLVPVERWMSDTSLASIRPHLA
jgi:hypothetical protein